MNTEHRPWRRPFGGYFWPRNLVPDPELTRVGPGTPAGEYLRRYWHPVAMTSELGTAPLPLRILGEDLVLFRDRGGRIGLLHRLCAHRGTSLGYGIPMERGLRCCYHGWTWDADGRCLDTPGEPPQSRLKESVFQGAYPVHELDGLVFAYMGPPAEQPALPIFDITGQPETTVATFSITIDCNWLQTHENGIDPMHAAFLHARPGADSFGSVFAVVPRMDLMETPGGFIVLTTRRWKDKVWTRGSEIVIPNLAHIPMPFETGETERMFGRAAFTRWVVPVDDTHNIFIGWRSFSATLDPLGKGDPARCGKNMIDFPGQEIGRDPVEAQRDPGDIEALVGQGEIAVHAAEHLGTSDRGVQALRRRLRQLVRAVAAGERIKPPESPWADGILPTYGNDTVLRIPPSGGDEGARLDAIARLVHASVVSSTEQPRARRAAWIETRVRDGLSSL
ncbi:MAG: aromatic ring-hydroxylating dioxygenase subunit alpha [Alphaproteobacteria bacterium]|nr:aromatic ring-hydroxylating dioxygenase subunit alpha [Alphaproteobacteria bacterium]